MGTDEVDEETEPLEAIYVRSGPYTLVMAAWAYELLRDMGVELEVAEVVSPPEHAEFGPISI